MGFLKSGSRRSTYSDLGLQSYQPAPPPPAGRGLLLTGSLAALSFLLIGAAGWFALQAAPNSEDVAGETVRAAASSADSTPQSNVLGTSATLKTPQEAKKEAARLAILNNAGSNLQLLELHEVEELTGIVGTRDTKKEAARVAILSHAGNNLELLEIHEVEELTGIVGNRKTILTQQSNLAAATQIRSAPAVQAQPKTVVIAAVNETSQIEEIEVVAPQETVPAPAQLAARDCVEELRLIAKRSTIYFQSGGAQIDANGLNILRYVGGAAAACPEALVHVTGHSDSSGSDAANLTLSWQRADNTVAALNAMGIDTSHFEPVGFGARTPSSQGDSGDLDLDRRVEFHILDAN